MSRHSYQPVLYNPSVGGIWKDVLSELTVPGDWLVHLGVCTYLGTHDSALDFTLSVTTNNPWLWRGVSAGNVKYNIRNLEHIVAHYKAANGSNFAYPSHATNVMEVFLRGIIDRLIAFAIEKSLNNSKTNCLYSKDR